MKCPACSSEQDNFVEQHGSFKLLDCRHCGLVFSSPMHGGDSGFYKQHLFYRDVDGATAAMHARSVRKRSNTQLLSQIPKGGRVLDVGCGVGAFVSLAVASGLDAHGIDFNEAHIAAGRRYFQLGERLRVAGIADLEASFGKASFDLVTLFEVVEHVEAPRELLTQVRNVLRPGGLVALSCPNEARWMPTGRVFVDYPPHHLTRWRPDTMRLFLENNGFDHVTAEIESSIADLIWVAYVNWSAIHRTPAKVHIPRIPRDTISNVQRLKLAVFSTVKRLSWPSDLLLRIVGVGTMGMRVVAKKRPGVEESA